MDALLPPNPQQNAALIGNPDLPQANPLDGEVNEIATQAIRIGSMALMTAAAGLAASYGFIAGVAVFGAGLVVSQLIIINARSTFLDMDSQLSGAEKAQLIAQARFWEDAVFSSTIAGIGGALAYNGVSSILSSTLWSVLLGIIGTAGGGFLAFLGCDGANGADDFGNDPSNLIRRLNLLHDSLTQARNDGKAVPEELASFILQAYISPKTYDQLIDAVTEHQGTYHFEIENYFRHLSPILLGTGLEAFVHQFPELKDWNVLLSVLSDEALNRYTISDARLDKAQQNILAAELQGNNEPFNLIAWQLQRWQLQPLQTALHLATKKLDTLPDNLDDANLGQRLYHLKLHNVRIKALLDRLNTLIETNDEKAKQA